MLVAKKKVLILNKNDTIKLETLKLKRQWKMLKIKTNSYY